MTRLLYIMELISTGKVTMTLNGEVLLTLMPTKEVSPYKLILLNQQGFLSWDGTPVLLMQLASIV
jgi:hypothetical protein